MAECPVPRFVPAASSSFVARWAVGCFPTDDGFNFAGATLFNLRDMAQTYSSAGNFAIYGRVTNTPRFSSEFCGPMPSMNAP